MQDEDARKATLEGFADIIETFDGMIQRVMKLDEMIKLVSREAQPDPEDRKVFEEISDLLQTADAMLSPLEAALFPGNEKKPETIIVQVVAEQTLPQVLERLQALRYKLVNYRNIVKGLPST